MIMKKTCALTFFPTIFLLVLGLVGCNETTYFVIDDEGITPRQVEVANQAADMWRAATKGEADAVFVAGAHVPAECTHDGFTKPYKERMHVLVACRTGDEKVEEIIEARSGNDSFSGFVSNGSIGIWIDRVNDSDRHMLVLTLHELGHLFGLGHSEDPASTMFPHTDNDYVDDESARLVMELSAEAKARSEIEQQPEQE